MFVTSPNQTAKSLFLISQRNCIKIQLSNRGKSIIEGPQRLISSTMFQTDQFTTALVWTENKYRVSDQVSKAV